MTQMGGRGVASPRAARRMRSFLSSGSCDSSPPAFLVVKEWSVRASLAPGPLEAGAAPVSCAMMRVLDQRVGREGGPGRGEWRRGDAAKRSREVCSSAARGCTSSGTKTLGCREPTDAPHAGDRGGVWRDFGGGRGYELRRIFSALRDNDARPEAKTAFPNSTITGSNQHSARRRKQARLPSTERADRMSAKRVSKRQARLEEELEALKLNANQSTSAPETAAEREASPSEEQGEAQQPTVRSAAKKPASAFAAVSGLSPIGIRTTDS